MTPDDLLDAKRALVRSCRLHLLERADLMQHNLDDAQQEANAHVGAMSSRYDTFKEEAQMRRDGFAVELDKTLRLLQVLDDLRLRPLRTVGCGSLVHLIDGDGRSLRLFLFAHLTDEPLEVGGHAYRVVSLTSPLGRVLAGRERGEVVSFRGRTYRIAEVG